MHLSYFHSEDTDRDLVIDSLREAFMNVEWHDGTLEDFLDDCREMAIEDADVSPLFVLTDKEVREEYDDWLGTIDAEDDYEWLAGA